MNRTDTVVIGGGQAGLAASRCLTDAGRDHVVLERAEVAQRWRAERWDSLRLLTPNWMTRLPTWSYGGDEPDGFMTAGEFVQMMETYAQSFAAPVQTGTTVEAVRPRDDDYEVTTDHRTWRTRNVVIATGDCGRPHAPPFARELADSIHQLSPRSYRNPDSVPEGGVLVVGAGATGVQLADELSRAGRSVTLAAGRHTRLPRRYRDRDIFWWLERLGLNQTLRSDVADPEAVRSAPSSQLIGTREHRDLDLRTLTEQGVTLAGRVQAANSTRVWFEDNLAVDVAAAQGRLDAVLARIDTCAGGAGGDRPAPVEIGTPPAEIDLRAAGIRTVVWATGFRRDYPWLHVPLLDRRGEILHRDGLTRAPGVYVLGLRFQRRRNSHFIDGVGADARFVVDHITRRSARSAAA